MKITVTAMTVNGAFLPHTHEAPWVDHETTATGDLRVTERDESGAPLGWTLYARRQWLQCRQTEAPTQEVLRHRAALVEQGRTPNGGRAFN